MTFESWKRKVDEHLIAICGMTSEDLPDANWYDYYESTLYPLDAIDCAILDQWYDIPGIENLYNDYTSVTDGV